MGIYRLYSGSGESHLEELDLAGHPKISLSGYVEIGLGDGTTVRYNPGDARLVEDTTGRGHTTRLSDVQSSDQPCIHGVIPLAD